ncbi:hypothetical protein [Streptomyces sp. NPDC005141]
MNSALRGAFEAALRAAWAGHVLGSVAELPALLGGFAAGSGR